MLVIIGIFIAMFILAKIFKIDTQKNFEGNWKLVFGGLALFLIVVAIIGSLS
jgi:galactitol-specific phosphotransferase system IIC component